MLRHPYVANLVQRCNTSNVTKARHTTTKPFLFQPCHRRIWNLKSNVGGSSRNRSMTPLTAKPVLHTILQLSRMSIHHHHHLNRTYVSLLRHTTLRATRAQTTSASATTSNSGRTKWKWRYLANGIKIVRIPIVILGVYKLGYQQGLMDYSRKPDKQKAIILGGVLKNVLINGHPTEIMVVAEGEGSVERFKLSNGLGGGTDDDAVDSTVSTKNAQTLRNVKVVAQKIVRTARKMFRTEYRDLQQYIGSLSPEEREPWIRVAKQQEGQMERIGIDGDSNDETKWTFFLIDTPVANAFVHELVPHSIFITTAMLEKFIETDDELALVLGHEISHLILGHSSFSNKIASTLGALEVLLLSLDPTEGLLSLLFMGGIGYLKRVLAAIYSRNNEREADRLGIRIAAMACFDTKSATQVFYKMAKETSEREQQNQEGSDRDEVEGEESFTTVTRFTDTHPPSIERYAELNSLSEKENADTYKDSYCAVVKSKFMAALRFGRLGAGST